MFSKNCPCGKEDCQCPADLALLLVRIGLAAVFISTGWMKFSDMSKTVEGFAQMGFSAPLAYAVAIIELVGGLVVLLGLGVVTRIAGVLLAIILLVAIVKVKYNLAATLGFVGSWAFDLVLLLSSLAVAVSGGGAISVMSLLKGAKKKSEGPGPAAAQSPESQKPA
jgi:uncharacterized membrane protein YphA (DoxX/SURF4 family)